MAVKAKTLSFSVPGGKQAAGLARRSVLTVEADLPGTVRHRVALLLSELVTNAVQHGGADAGQSVQVRVRSSSERVRVEVLDPGGVGPRPRERVEEGAGYGTLLVDRLADGSGRQAVSGGGSVAWFELDLYGL